MKGIPQIPTDLLFVFGILGGVALTFAVSLGIWFFLGRIEVTDDMEATGEAVEHESTPTPSIIGTLSPVSGVTSYQVVFGQSAAFSGPAQELGIGMRRGILAAFKEANDAGGVHGRTLKLVWRDDSYEPEAAVANTIELIEEEMVFGLIGAVGTPTSRSAVPVAEDRGVPYIAPFTGAALLRDPELDYVINLRASYNQETEEMVARLTEDLGMERISVMYQDDSYGLAGYHGTLAALESRDMQPASVGVYTRNTLAVKTGLLDLYRGSPQAVIVIGAYEPVAELILWARRLGMDVVFVNISFVGSNALATALCPERNNEEVQVSCPGGEGVFVTQVVPFPVPTEKSPPIVQSYVDALKAYDPRFVPGFVSLEGYLAGRLAIAGLERCGPDLDRACFLAGLRATNEDLDGFALLYRGDDDNQGSDEVFLTVIGSDGHYQSIETLREFVP